MHAHEHAFVLNKNEALQCMLTDKVLLIYLQGFISKLGIHGN